MDLQRGSVGVKTRQKKLLKLSRQNHARLSALRAQEIKVFTLKSGWYRDNSPLLLIAIGVFYLFFSYFYRRKNYAVHGSKRNT